MNTDVDRCEHSPHAEQLARSQHEQYLTRPQQAVNWTLTMNALIVGSVPGCSHSGHAEG